MSTYQEEKSKILEQVKSFRNECFDGPMVLGEFAKDPAGDGYYRNRPPFEHVDITSYAEGQLLARLRIPARYIHRCHNRLQADNINHWISRDRSKELLTRWHRDTIRAIFSTRFSPDMDDHLLLPEVFDALEQEFGDKLSILCFSKVGDFTVLQIGFPDLSTSHGANYVAGIQIANSEVGRSSLRIQPLVAEQYEYHTRYSFIDSSQEGAVSIRHIGDLNATRIREAVLKAREVAQVGIYRLLEAEQEIIINPVQEVKNIVEDSDFLTERLIDIAEETWKDTQETTKLKLARSILEAVSELPLFQKYIAEKEIGRYLNLFQDTTERLDSIVEQHQKLYAVPEGIMSPWED